MAEHYHRIAPGGRFWIERPALLDRLDQAAAYTLTLLPAPAGSGKSTLLQQWRAARPQWQIATLSLTRRDADPVRFFSRLDAAVREVVPDFEGLSYNDLSAEAALPAAVLVDALLQALAEVRGPFFLLIDEFQFAGDPLIHAVLSGVLQGSPASLGHRLSWPAAAGLEPPATGGPGAEH
jgi:LuxR family transcriptional regulator, maltose regulon positive regulatory protein